jgi:hypothetical protein
MGMTVSLMLVLIITLLITGCVQAPAGNPMRTGEKSAVPDQTSANSGSGVLPENQVVPTPNSGAGQYNPSSPAGAPQKTYAVGATLLRSGQLITVTYSGGQDAPFLQSIVWYINSVNVGVMASPDEGGQTFLPVGTRATYPIRNPGFTNHIVGIGHFLDGSTQVILDTTR